MPPPVEPVVLELAMLGRDQMGPFLILGVPKEGARDQLEAAWADRLRKIRNQRLKIPLEDVNWARDMLSDVDKRLRADANSLNADTADGLLGQLARRYGMAGPGKGARGWQPLDREKPLADYMPPAEVPDHQAMRNALVVPEVPCELPAVPQLLERLALAPLDPWTLELPRAGGVDGPSSQDTAP
jgi:hypothetical protein